MCGISGYVSLSGKARRDLDHPMRVVSSLTNRRGPDFSGMWTSSNYSIGFYHRRLSIIDSSTFANQPYIDHNLGFVLAFNGEIYNYKELRSRLSSLGYQFSTCSDTEVLLVAFAEWGTSCFDLIRGMYAFAIHNLRTSETYIARDPYGIKPLYYSLLDDTLFFSSQISALKQSSLPIGNSISSAGFVSFMLNGSVYEPYTIYKDISSLPSGSYIRISGDCVSNPIIHSSVSQIWSSSRRNHVISEDQYISSVRKHVEDSISHHMVADCPVGLFLSGGIDSSAILSLINSQVSSPISTFTLGFSDFKGSPLDETPLASAISNLYGSIHTTSWLTNDNLFEQANMFHQHIEQPTIDGFNTWLVSSLASQHGFKVALSGVGADELFGGYPSFWQVPLMREIFSLLNHFPFVRSFLPSIANFIVDNKLSSSKFLNIPFSSPSIANLYKFRRSLFTVRELLCLFDEAFILDGFDQLISHIAGHAKYTFTSSFAELASLESTLYLKNQLLRDADWCSMHHSLEVRTPFVDFSLLKALAPMLVSYNKSRIKPSKSALTRLTSSPLPSFISKKPKTGFNVPLNTRISSMRNFALPSRFSISKSLSSPVKQYAYLIASLYLDS